ncbi:MAG TPA: sigma-54 dependent transcriptional regulator [Vicinamibacterales bacterium]|jgi:two-component system response regulator AtoC|nr:sigma-54 dependent transcriptional regulator [Vicinamibacterales bacterium]
MPDSKPNILLVDDEDALRGVVAERLEEEGFTVVEAPSGEAALDQLQRFAFDIVISDLRLPGIDGRQVIDAALERYPGILAIVVTGYATVKDAVDVIKRGAADFVAKPFQFDELLHVIHSAREQQRLKDENAYLREQLAQRFGLGAMVGKSAAMLGLYQLIETVAGSNATVLITGETGTGKEMVARAIHQSSLRRQQRFVALNCGAIPESLLEAELFGHVRGAFTGAVGNRLGRIEQADRGTLFLDEVGNMPSSLQMKLLRVLQEREFERIGDPRSVKVDVRVIAATNADLGKMVREATFREDLFYRLNVVAVQLPPLRERLEDIPLLVARFVEKLQPAGEGRESIVVSQNAMRRLMAHKWPGNVRQLENIIERALALSGGRRRIDVDDLPADIRGEEVAPTLTPGLPESGVDLPALVLDFERHLIDQALTRTEGNRGAAARLLGLKRTTLVEKLRRLAAADPEVALTAGE